MSLDIPGTISGQINIGSYDSATIATHNLHCNTRAAFETTADVVAVPSETQWDLRIYA
jgi:hypothetical protein